MLSNLPLQKDTRFSLLGGVPVASHHLLPESGEEDLLRDLKIVLGAFPIRLLSLSILTSPQDFVRPFVELLNSPVGSRLEHITVLPRVPRVPYAYEEINPFEQGLRHVFRSFHLRTGRTLTMERPGPETDAPIPE
jgi:hypothetical protein